MSKNSKSTIGNEPITDARKLGIPKMLVLGLQHMFAMFGATVLVPMITGLDVSTTLLMAGLGTLLFHLITKMKVPAFLGSSFAFLGGYAAVKAAGAEQGLANALPYACLGVACAGLVYLVLAFIIKVVGITRVMKFFPPVVTGPIIITIGLILAPSAINNCTSNWILAIIALLIVIVFNIWGKGMAKIIPIILGVIGAYVSGLILYYIGQANPGLIQDVPWLFSGGFNADTGLYAPIFDFTNINAICQNIASGQIFGSQGLIGFPINFGRDGNTIFAIDWANTSMIVSSIVAIIPISLATMMEHIGDISAIGATTGKNFIADPGLHRSLTGDGLATTIASIFGGPANTTYGENTGVLALTKVYDPRVVRIAACFAVGISFFPIVSAVISTIPAAVIGGISVILYGMISSIGVRNMVESKVDLTKSRNLIVAAVIIVSALGISFSSAVGGSISFILGSATISLSGLAVAAIVGIFLNAILPGKDYVFSADSPSETGVNFAVGANSKRQEPEETE
ncbi:MAG: ABC transporter permease [Clostridiales bacterium]|nr:MAG: ABC transporter permease [Clostridiales bacterium]